MLKGARRLAVLGTRAAVCTILVSFLSLPGIVLAQDAAQGQETFQTLCSACHTIGGGRLVADGHQYGNLSGGLHETAFRRQRAARVDDHPQRRAETR